MKDSIRIELRHQNHPFAVLNSNPKPVQLHDPKYFSTILKNRNQQPNVIDSWQQEFQNVGYCEEEYEDYGEEDNDYGLQNDQE